MNSSRGAQPEGGSTHSKLQNLQEVNFGDYDGELQKLRFPSGR